MTTSRTCDFTGTNGANWPNLSDGSAWSLYADVPAGALRSGYPTATISSNAGTYSVGAHDRPAGLGETSAYVTSTSNATSYNISSWGVTAGVVYVMCVQSTLNTTGTPSDPSTLPGQGTLGISWVKVGSVTRGSTVVYKMTLWVMCPTSSGTIVGGSVSFGAETQQGCIVRTMSHAGALTTNGGQDAILNVSTNSGTAATSGTTSLTVTDRDTSSVNVFAGISANAAITGTLAGNVDSVTQAAGSGGVGSPAQAMAGATGVTSTGEDIDATVTAGGTWSSAIWSVIAYECRSAQYATYTASVVTSYLALAEAGTRSKRNVRAQLLSLGGFPMVRRVATRTYLYARSVYGKHDGVTAEYAAVVYKSVNGVITQVTTPNDGTATAPTGCRIEVFDTGTLSVVGVYASLLDGSGNVLTSYGGNVVLAEFYGLDGTSGIVVNPSTARSGSEPDQVTTASGIDSFTASDWTIEAAFLSSTAVVYSPSVPVIQANYVAPTSAVYAPTVAQVTPADYIDSASAVYAPTVASLVVLPTIAATVVLYAPAVGQLVVVPQIAGTAIYSPGVFASTSTKGTLTIGDVRVGALTIGDVRVGTATLADAGVGTITVTDT